MPGWYHADDLEEARAWLFKKGCAVKVSLNHKAELRKLSATLPGGRLVVVQTPEALADCARLAAHFGETYRLSGLPATVGKIILRALRPKREACTDAQRMELWKTGWKMCALPGNFARSGGRGGPYRASGG